jgi:hypothetical protein
VPHDDQGDALSCDNRNDAPELLAMAAEKDFETETMARIYADQGHYDKAAAIYRQLLMQTPERDDLRGRLEAVEASQKAADTRNLADHMSEWVQLLMKKRQIDKLRKLRKHR